MDSEQPRKAAFADLQARTYEFELVSPDDEVLVVEMKAITPAERAQLELKDDKRPTPPISDYRKIDEAVYPIYDVQDAGYLEQMAAWNRRFQARIILRSLQMDVPGETVAEQVENLQSMAAWAMDGLWQAVQLLLVAGEDRLRRRGFRGAREADTAAV